MVLAVAASCVLVLRFLALAAVLVAASGRHLGGWGWHGCRWWVPAWLSMGSGMGVRLRMVGRVWGAAAGAGARGRVRVGVGQGLGEDSPCGLRARWSLAVFTQTLSSVPIISFVLS